MANPRGNPNNDDRSGNGRFTPSMKTADRRAKAAWLRIEGHTPAQIAAMPELGFTDARAVNEALRAAREAAIREPGEELLRIELERLDAQLLRLNKLEARARKVLDAHHIVVNNGKVIYHPETNQPMEDDAPILQAIDRLVKIEDARNRNAERRAKLTGIEAAVKLDTTVHEVDAKDIELAELIREAQARNAAQEARIKGETG